jgi:hypothetical protein
MSEDTLIMTAAEVHQFVARAFGYFEEELRKEIRTLSHDDQSSEAIVALLAVLNSVQGIAEVIVE